jgi:hypothetical protein
MHYKDALLGKHLEEAFKGVRYTKEETGTELQITLDSYELSTKIQKHIQLMQYAFPRLTKIKNDTVVKKFCEFVITKGGWGNANMTNTYGESQRISKEWLVGQVNSGLEEKQRGVNQGLIEQAKVPVHKRRMQ